MLFAVAELLVLNALASKGVCVNEKHSRKRERWPAGPYSSGAGSGVVLRHRAASAVCACLTVDAAAAVAYCTPESAAQIKPANGFLHNH